MYATEVVALLNHDYFNPLLLTRHGAALEQLLAEHGRPGTPVVDTPGYTPAMLMPHYRWLKTSDQPTSLLEGTPGV